MGGEISGLGAGGSVGSKSVVLIGMILLIVVLGNDGTLLLVPAL